LSSRNEFASATIFKQYLRQSGDRTGRKEFSRNRADRNPRLVAESIASAPGRFR
jgi:hypothetical protein